MKVTKLEPYGLDLLVELDPPSANPALTLASCAGVVREAGPAHRGHPQRLDAAIAKLPQAVRYVPPSPPRRQAAPTEDGQ